MVRTVQRLFSFLAAAVISGCASTAPVATTEVVPPPPPSAPPASQAEDAPPGERREPLLSRLWRAATGGQVRECDQLIEVVNASKIGDNVGDDKKKLMAEAVEARRLAREIDKLTFDDIELIQLVSQFSDNLEDYALMMQKASVTSDNDLDGLMQLVKEAGDVAASNSELTSKINAHCSQ